MKAVQSIISTDKLLETRHAEDVISTIENAIANGLGHVVFELHPMETQLHPANLKFYDNEEEALDDWEMKTTGGYLPGDADFPVYYRNTAQLLAEVRLANPELPQHLIAGVIFSYDVKSDAFIEKGTQTNRIPMAQIWEDQLWSQFFFDNQTKNIYQGGFPNGERPNHVQLVVLPTIPYCDKLGIPVKTYQEKQMAETMQKQQDAKKSKVSKIKNRRRM